jgi:K+-sensing histidine kinase KdpD
MGVRAGYASILAYGAAGGWIAAAALLNALLLPVLGRDVSNAFTLILAAVALSAWTGGRGPGRAAVLLGALAGDYLFLAPRWSLAIAERHDALRLGVFVLTGLLITELIAALKAARQRAEDLRASTETARRHATFLAEAGRQLAGSLDYETTLTSVARLAVPYMADYCIVDLVVESDGGIRRVAVTHGDPSKERLARELYRYPPDPRGPNPIPEALRSGRPQVIPAFTPTTLWAVTRDETHFRIVRALGLAACMAVPLVARGRVLGAITFASAGSGRSYGPAEVALGEALAQRAALAVDNARLYHDAQAAVHARDVFLARASHELRTPLTSALGTIRMLKKAAAGLLPEPTAALLDVASRNLGTMADLINDLLDVSKLAAGRDTLALEPTDLAAVVARALEVVGPQAREQGVRVTSAVPAGLVLAADPMKLEQVVVNLLANAAKFTPAGGEVAVQAAAEGRDVVLRVRDTGEGIAREHLEAIFEPFVQAGRRKARRERGTGLGLAICRQIVTLHGGVIHAESEGAGRGSTFVVRLPAAAAAGRLEAPTAA